MGAEVSNQSNSFLPFGKVRMGYPSGRIGGGCYSIRINHPGAYLGFLLQNTGLSYKHTDIGPHLTSPEGEGQIL